MSMLLKRIFPFIGSIRPIKLLHREVFPEELYPLITVTLPDGKVQFNL